MSRTVEATRCGLIMHACSNKYYVVILNKQYVPPLWIISQLAFLGLHLVINTFFNAIYMIPPLSSSPMWMWVVIVWLSCGTWAATWGPLPQMACWAIIWNATLPHSSSSRQLEHTGHIPHSIQYLCHLLIYEVTRHTQHCITLYNKWHQMPSRMYNRLSLFVYESCCNLHINAYKWKKHSKSIKTKCLLNVHVQITRQLSDPALMPLQ